MLSAHAPGIQLEGMPFAYDALEPHISRQAMTLHHTKHHAKHVAIINGMIQGTEMEKDSLEEIMLKAFRCSNMGLFNNAASSWNHEFFWKCLRSRAFLSPPLCARMAAEFLPCSPGRSLLVSPLVSLGGGSYPRI